ncbi:copper transporter, partial [Escherichia coli]|nr:copper transporter [Escherichia coli]
MTGSSNVVAMEQARGLIESTRSDIAKRQGELAQANNALQLLLGSNGKVPQAQTVNSASRQSVKSPPGLAPPTFLNHPCTLEAVHAAIARIPNMWFRAGA